jgi:MFS family permease
MATMAAAQETGTRETFPSFLRALPALLVLTVAVAIAFVVLGIFSTVQESAKAEMHLSDMQMGLIQGLSMAVPLGLLSIPLGIAVDRSHRMRILIVMAVVWTIGTAMTGLAQSAGLLFVARMLASVGAVGALTATIPVAADLCEPGHRGRAMLILTLGKSLGVAGGFALGGWLLGAFDHGAHWFGAIAPWRGVHLALAIISIAGCLPLLLLREPARREVAAGTHAPFRMVLRELWARRGFVLPLFVGMTAVVMADAAAVIWASPVLSRSYGLKPEQFASWMGALLFGAGIVGSILGGFAADLGHKSGRKGGVLIGAVIGAAIAAPAGLFPVCPSVTLFAVALGLLVIGGTIAGLITSVAITVLLPNELRGLCIGAFLAVAGLLGYGLAPSLVTWVSGALGGEAHLGAALAIIGTITGILSVFGFFQAMRAAPEPIR